MMSKTAVEYPNFPSILALVGGALILLFDVMEGPVDLGEMFTITEEVLTRYD